MAGKDKAVERVYAIEDLVKAGPAVFNVSPEVMTGALYGLTDALTMDQAAAKLKEYLSKPIK